MVELLEGPYSLSLSKYSWPVQSLHPQTHEAVAALGHAASSTRAYSARLKPV